eukprot:1843459-Rhodomonas_salina.1
MTTAKTVDDRSQRLVKSPGKVGAHVPNRGRAVREACDFGVDACGFRVDELQRADPCPRARHVTKSVPNCAISVPYGARSVPRQARAIPLQARSVLMLPRARTQYQATHSAVVLVLLRSKDRVASSGQMLATYPGRGGRGQSCRTATSA